MSRFANGIRGSAVKFPPSRLPGSLAVHFSGMGVTRQLDRPRPNASLSCAPARLHKNQRVLFFGCKRATWELLDLSRLLLLEDVLVLSISRGQRLLRACADNEVESRHSWYGGDERNRPIGVLFGRDLTLPFAEVEVRLPTRHAHIEIS